MIRLGYACISMATPNNPNKKTTVAQLSKLDHAERLKKLRKVMQTNFFNLMDVLEYNVNHQIFLYRLPSEFVPLATHQIAADWNWQQEFAWDFTKAGEYIRKFNIRLTSHPGHYSILNTPNKNVLQSTIKDFDYHARVFDAMGLDNNSVLVTHVGGVYGDKQESLARFKHNLGLLPPNIINRLVVENDDTSFTMLEVLDLCERVGLPMVLDIHHHHCVNNGEEIAHFIPRIIATWGERNPKMHFSSPRSDEDFKSHADNLIVEDFLTFMDLVKNHDLDIMLECKNKDEALLKLRKELHQKGIRLEPVGT
ncbi:UV DNA damage repair endonuclease UvsE [Brevibacillus sp. SYSU BS000544]|uniref:UV DNA damage repair endonuclease UvsE n=1 Tax=Brevibacillus sp. SYSU BS000544 TaxID=3416443 RepID=UPI003CE52EB1